MVRVTMSAVTDNEKPKHSRPHSIIRISSSRSSARHFRCRCRCSTNVSAMAMERFPSSRVLVDRADQVLDLLRMRAELPGELVEIGIGDRGEALLVDVFDHLDAERFQLG